MHALILGAGLCLLSTAHAGAAAPCPPAQAPVQEVFISADCADCWSAGEPSPGPQAKLGHWRLDWIHSGAADAPLSAAALPESAERLARRPGLAPPNPPATQGATAALALKVESGPAWSGYLGVQMTLRLAAKRPNKPPTLAPGSSAWLAMVERLPAGTDGSPMARELVRAVAGPLPLDSLKPGVPLSFLRAMRWPDTAQPLRLQARGWIESPTGQVLLMAADRCTAQ